jgi:hypothetical protein
LLQVLGVLAFTLPQVEILMPAKKPRGEGHTLAQQRVNQALHSVGCAASMSTAVSSAAASSKTGSALEGERPRSGDSNLLCPDNFQVRLTPLQPLV